MRSNNKERLAQGAKLIYDKNLETEEGRKLFWMMQGWKELPRNFKLIELINMVHTVPTVGTHNTTSKTLQAP